MIGAATNGTVPRRRALQRRKSDGERLQAQRQRPLDHPIHRLHRPTPRAIESHDRPHRRVAHRRGTRCTSGGEEDGLGRSPRRRIRRTRSASYLRTHRGFRESSPGTRSSGESRRRYKAFDRTRREASRGAEAVGPIRIQGADGRSGAS